MFDVILAMTKSGGVGNKGTLPWKCKKEMDIFKQKTLGKVVIMGRKTATSIGDLKKRKVVILSSRCPSECKVTINRVYKCLYKVLDNHKDNDIIVAGGAQIYNHVFKNLRHCINKVHISIMNDDYECDTFIDFKLSEWTLISKTKHDEFIHYVLSPVESCEKVYLQLLREVYINGTVRVGRNGITKSMFGKTLNFDLTNGFPLLTTRKMFFRGVVEELLFFIRGHTDSKYLEEKKINIWKGNTSRYFLNSIGMPERRSGVMGPMYGYQWRNYNAPYDEGKACAKGKGHDQLKDVVDKIRNEPNSRRILLTDFNPLQANEGVLFPCHSIIIQFYVDNGFLDMFCFNRSSDLFHGLPFNIASSALLHTFIAHITRLTARKFVLSIGDAHIYKSHYDVVCKQIERVPYKFPSLIINKTLNEIKDIEELRYTDIKICDYSSHPTLKVDMVI
jgi:thymidylate synthase